MTGAWFDSVDVKHLWEVISAAQAGEATNREQVQAWQVAAQSLDAHRVSLERYRAELSLVWPAEGSPAATAYLARVDELIAAVRATAEASQSNALVLNHVTDAISTAHTSLKPLYDKYVDNERQLAAYQSALDNVGTATSVTSGPLIGWVTRQATSLLTESPVPSGAQDQLTQQARALMKPLTATAIDATNRFTEAPTYVPPNHTDPGHEDQVTVPIGESDGGVLRPPVIAPPAHTALGVFLAGSPASGPTLRGDGLLAGSTVGTTSSPTAGSSTPVIGGVGQAGAVVPMSGGNLSPAVRGGVGGVGGGLWAGGIAEGWGRRIPPTEGPGFYRGPGGEAVIGRGPGASTPIPGTARGASTAGEHAPGPGLGAPGGTAGATAGRDCRRTPRHKPDTIWHTPKPAFPPVVKAPPTPDPSDFDPGPGVLGIDRW